MKKKKFYISVQWKIYGCIGILLLCIGYLNGCASPVNNAAAKESTADEFQGIYAEDNRLEFVSHETYEYDKDSIEKGKEEPVKIDDHCMDAIRYVVMGLWDKIKRWLPVPDD